MGTGADDAAAYCRHGLDSVEGYFSVEDGWAFLALDAMQRAQGIRGDLLEVGAYLGKSTIVLGYLPRDDETLVVCDPFEDRSPDDGLAVREMSCYDGLTQERFEANYRRFHAADPDVRVGTSDEILPTLPEHAFRFIHVDGGHSYDIVKNDLAATESLLCPGGIIAFDDMLERHTPGVPAAVWHAVVDAGLTPLAMTRKLYATWTPDPDLDLVREAFRARSELEIIDEHAVAGKRFLQVEPRSVPDRRSRRAMRAITPPGLVTVARRAQRAVMR
jgi:hypothetical protein